ncbi:probable chitinase 2 [Anopheles marshallii]|uniref:probable chitinase 2 n=1 Tax=Anopheles marshallii TaxID=1521116 RepID=UPI00237BF16C|nr:probable chitinase 2 [Anopheles marshallii]
MRAAHPHLKVLLAIGGWNEGSEKYSNLAANPERRQAFVTNALDFIKQYGFDGLDLDWEYPTQRGGKPADRENFVALVRELSQVFRKNNLLLTSAIGAGKDTIDAAYDVKALSKYLDFLHIMCYDYNGSWDGKIGPNAPLTSRDFLNVEYSIEHLLELGAPASKLVLGLPFYGRTFVSTIAKARLGDTADKVGFPGPATKENGFMGYNEVCEELKRNPSDWTLEWDSTASEMVAIKSNGSTSQVVVYDSTRSIANKVRFAVRQKLAGLMVWSVDTDDFNGLCAPEDDTYKDFGDRNHVALSIPAAVTGKYPLLKTISNAIIVASDELTQENVIPHEPDEVPAAGGTATGPSGATLASVSSSLLRNNIMMLPMDRLRGLGCLLLLSLVLLLLAGSGSGALVTDHDRVVTCYISTWAVYRTGSASYPLDSFDPTLCTHAIYAFAGLNEAKNTIKSLDAWQDLKDNYGKGGYEKLTKMRAAHPHLKVLLAVGGRNDGSLKYSNLAANPARRQAFVTNALDFIKQHAFDGLDLNWVYPTLHGGKPADRENFVALVRELSQEFRKNNLLLTAAIGAVKETIDSAFNVRELSNYLDLLHIVCYDYNGSWDGKIGPNAPLTSSDFRNVEYSIQYLLELGAPASKLVLGLPFYGRTFVSPMAQARLGDIANKVGFPGPATKESGFMGYNEVCQELKRNQSDWTLEWDPTASEMVAIKSKGTKSQVIVYDSTRSIANKVRFAVRQKLAGLMVWSVDTDDFNGLCAPEQDTYKDFYNSNSVALSIPLVTGKYPLLKTISNAITVASDKTSVERRLPQRITIVPQPNKVPEVRGATKKPSGVIGHRFELIPGQVVVIRGVDARRL